ncbi:MAG TPA: hypothetical protein VGJ87_04170 [Roseiflexaceae bacterium]|jgi:hypothetical protein
MDVNQAEASLAHAETPVARLARSARVNFFGFIAHQSRLERARKIIKIF